MSITYPTDRSTYAQSGSFFAQRVTSSEENPVTVAPTQDFMEALKYGSVGQLVTLTSSNPSDQSIIDFLLQDSSNGNLNNGGAITVKTQLTDLATSMDAYGTLLGVEMIPLAQADFNYNVNSELFITSSLSGSVSTLSGNVEVTCSGSAGDYAQIETKHYVRIRPGQGAGVRFSAQFTQPASGTQIYGWGSSTDGYFVGMTGSDFAVLHRSHGIETWTTSSDFNIDTLDGYGLSGVTITPSFGNVYDIQAQWLGYGAITFNIVNPNTGKFIPFHQIKYANANNVPSTRFNSEKVFARVQGETGGAVPLTIKGASILTYVEGQPTYTGPRFAVSNSKNGVSIPETNILTLQNKSTFHGFTNKVAIKLKSLAYAVEGTKPALIKIYKNATLGGTPSYTDINTNNSVISYDIAGTTVSSGSLVTSYALGKSSSDVVYGDDLDLWLYPGEYLTITAQSAANTDAAVSVSWIEDH
jgi:hypothetical protein